jgi:hypothetical protein
MRHNPSYDLGGPLDQWWLKHNPQHLAMIDHDGNLHLDFFLQAALLDTTITLSQFCHALFSNTARRINGNLTTDWPSVKEDLEALLQRRPEGQNLAQTEKQQDVECAHK